MATFKTRWLLSILLVNLPNCCVAAGSPAPPSNLKCYIPCDYNGCERDIHCTWDPRPDPQIPTNYSLHWEPVHREEGYVTNGTSLDGVIYREQYSRHSDLRVWVQAKNQHNSAKSQEVVFNTANINKWPPPQITLILQDPLEIFWNFTCDELPFRCDVRHRTEGDQVWNEDGGIYPSYSFDNSQPGIVYEFQVRCSCSTGLMSDWCAIHSSEMELDLWRDCGMSPTSVECDLTWKKLPLSQACGRTPRYEVTLFDNNGTVSANLSTAKPRGQLVCDEMKCHLTSSLKDVLSASVSAYDTCCRIRTSNLTVPIQGKKENEQGIHLKMNKNNLFVSWNLPAQPSDNLSYKEYVVQYKQAGSPPGQGFDWVRVKKGHTTGIFKGQFIEQTPYQVSLFTVSHRGECHHISSVIGYSLQGTPSKVPSFKVNSISATHVTLFWEPVPLYKQKGVILHYQIGVDRQNVVYIVNVSKQHESQTFELLHLSPGQEYEVWIKAVTLAGPGANVTTRFKTKHQENFGLSMLFLLVPFILAIICFPVFLSACRGESKACPLVPSCFYEKVPDPHNSRIFRQMKHQMNDPLAWIHVSINEPHPNISVLEIVKIQPMAFESSLETTSHPDRLTRPLVGGGSSQIDCQDDQREDAVIEECDRTEHRYEREEYSRMVDSDEERDREEEDRDDSWCSSEEEEFPLGYEKHFMPTALEVLEF